VNTAEPFRLSSRGTQDTVEEELRASIPHQTVPLQVKVYLDVEGFHRVRIVWVGCQQHHTVLPQYDIIYDITYDIMKIII
jgi:hypothetical protein